MTGTIEVFARPRAAARSLGPRRLARGEPAAGPVRPGGGTILDAIGNTPLVMVDGVWVKSRYLNPSGSIKARIAEVHDRAAGVGKGLLHPGDTIVEASSGNTGNAMSMVAAVKGYRMLSGHAGRDEAASRLAISRAFGAQVMTLGDFHVNDALAQSPNSAASPDTSRRSSWSSGVERREDALARPETLAQLPDSMVWDAVVGGSAPGAPSSVWASASANATNRAGSLPSSPMSRARADVRG